MSRERWGTFSVRDHLRKEPFAAEVLMYDRLVIPFPPTPAERTRWSKAGWKPKRLEPLLEILRVDGVDSKRHAIAAAWDDGAEKLFRSRVEGAIAVDNDANLRLSRQLLATELRPEPPHGVIPTTVVAAYPSVHAVQREWVQNDVSLRRETLTVALAHQFLVPDPTGKTELELLQEAVDLADDADFRQKRARMYDWQEDIIDKGFTDKQALAEMAQYVADYGQATRKAFKKVRWKFVFTLIPIAMGVAIDNRDLMHLAGPAATLLGFWIFDRKPIAAAAENDAAAMFHTVQKGLGWRTAQVAPNACSELKTSSVSEGKKAAPPEGGAAKSS